MSATVEPLTVGVLLREWRTARGKSQMTTSIEAGISSRHLSFVETGRSNPSREMILTLAETLEIPLRERNTLLEAAGFAAVYRETPLDARAMTDVRAALMHILSASEPHPTLVVNRRYDILMVNPSAARVLAFFAPGGGGQGNVARSLLAHDGLRPHLQNWGVVAAHVVHRTRAELSSSRIKSAEDTSLLAELDEADALLRRQGHPATGRAILPPSVLLPLKLRRGDVELDMFTTVTTLGTPLDITLQEIRIETLYPSNAESRETLLSLVRGC